MAGVLDLGSRRVVGWAMGKNLETSLPMDALQMALGHRQPKAGLFHHSDRGCQYASDAYRDVLRRHGAVASMSRAGNCYDNARMESFCATLKTELIGDHVFTTRAEAKSAIFGYIEISYNRVQLHGALGFHSPVDFEHSLN